MTELQAINNTLKDNANVIGRRNNAKIVYKGIKNLQCLYCEEEFDFTTNKTVYLFNRHGSVICKPCFKRY